ncbi:N-carbamoyl-L-amino-acid hydrolase [Curtobacterium sp. 9128]|uniref:allantoate amidohydrolase n=1 Tax=Curtobacterium sp. 9128 TaxID=1793722 RepID=UPI0007D72F50|nr:allantoate amidohydrolase [Curtobacterium sp. 9128]SBN64635.1 N-carbamoyl-L-amino-acid hydrolase [Curtobacterium sp. 9128]
MTDSGATVLPGLAEIAEVGRDTVRGGYSRHLLDDAERDLRDWFVERAERLGLDVEHDRNGNTWAWWGTPGPDAFVTGSHLDSVPGGGAFDGPLGVVSALDAVARLQQEGHRPSRPTAIAVFAEEEGSRFGVACLGSRLLSGAISPERALALTDVDGTSLEAVLTSAGIDPSAVGPDPDRLAGIGTFVELHVEQGRGLVDLGSPVALASSILGHGRWRFRFSGQGNHAGATLMTDRRDPVVAAAAAIAAVPGIARAAADARATVGRLRAVPGGTNVIASTAEFWLDARAGEDTVTRTVVGAIVAAAEDAATANGCALEVTEESWSSRVDFPEGPRAAIDRVLAGDVPVLPTGAGHDAGVLSTHVPSAMLFVRNPTGVSHAPEEWSDADDCAAGVEALTTVMRAST